MSDSSTPRKGELFLEALGAGTEFRDEVIGDLAEEFALRVTWDGPVVARRWYYRECTRVAPYLIRDWWRNVRRGDVSHIANVVGLSSVCMLTMTWFLLLTVVSVVWVVGGPPALRSLVRSPPMIGIVSVTLVWNFVIGIFGGVIAAWASRRTPIASTVALALAWTLPTVVSHLLRGPPTTPVALAVHIASVTLLVAGTLLGGLLRTCNSDARTDAPSTV